MSHSVSPHSVDPHEAAAVPESLANALAKVRSAPTDLEAWEQLNEVCREHDRPEEAVALYGEVLEAGQSGQALEDVGRAAADFCEEWYEETAPVLAMLSAVLRSDPRQTWAFERLTVLLTVAARWEELLAAYDEALAATEDQEWRCHLLTEAAKIARDFAGMGERASDYLKALLLLRLSDDQLAALLEKRLDEQARHQDLIEIWTARLAVLPEEVGKKTRLQIARRHLDFLRDAESTLVDIRLFLEAGGSELLACDILEDIADSEAASVSARREALTMLDELHSAAERFDRVIFATERALLLSTEKDDKLRLQKRARELYRQVHQPESALEHAAHILELDSDDDEARSIARSLAAQVGRIDRFVVAVVAAAGVTDSGQRRVELLLEAAETCRVDLEEPERAAELFARVEADPASSDEARLLSCQRLTDLLRAADREDELLEILEKRADLESKEGRVEMLGQAANLATKLGQLERALGLWSLRLVDDVRDEEAQSSKIELFTELGRHQGLVDALVARSLLGEDPARQRSDLVRAANAYAEELKDLDTAIDTWTVIEKRFGREDESVDALIALSGRAGKFDQVASLLVEGIAATEDDWRKVDQLGQLAETQRLHLGDPGAALDSYQAALKIDPRFEPARGGLRALMLEPELAHKASEALVDAFGRAGDRSEIIALLESRLAAAPDAAFQSLVLLETAQLREDEGDIEGALSDICRAFAMAPQEETEQRLNRLAVMNDDFVSAVDAYTAAISGSADEKRVEQLYLARGRLQQVRLGLPDEATTSFYEALRRNPANREIAFLMIGSGQQSRRYQDAAWALVEHSRALQSVDDEVAEFFHGQVDVHGEWKDALTGLVDGINAADGLSPEVTHDLKKRLAIWYRDQARDLDAAEIVLRRAAAELPRPDSLIILAELQRRHPGRALVDTLVTLADVNGEQLSVLREAGDIALAKVGDQELSKRILERSLAAAKVQFAEAGGVESDEGFYASDVCAWGTDNLVTIALTEGDSNLAVELLDGSAELPFLPSEQVARRFRAAEVAAAAKMDERAVQLCEAVLGGEPEHEGAITLLSQLHEKAGRLEQLLDLRRRELRLERPRARRLFLRLDQSRVLGQLAADPTERISVVRQNLVDLPGHAESVEAVTSLLWGTGAYGELATLLEEQAAAIVETEPERAALLWQRAGHIADDQLTDEARLVSDFKLSAAASPSIIVVDRLAAIDCEHSRHESEVSWLTLRLSLTPEVPNEPGVAMDRRQVVVRLGTALVRTDEHRAACQVLEQELRKDPAANSVRSLLASVYEQLEKWRELSTTLYAGVAFAEDDAAKIENLRRAALVERKNLGDLEAAIPLLKQASDLDDTDRGLKLLLADTLAAAEFYDEAAYLLEGLLEEFGRRRTKERATVHKQLARIAQATGDLDAALEQAEAAAKIERTDAGILMLVGQLASEKGQLERAEQAYRTLALIASRRSQANDTELEEVGESAVLFELYRIATVRKDAEQAKELLQSALEVAAARPNEAVSLAEALIATDQVDLMLDALTGRIEAALDPHVAAQLLITRANILEKCERLSDALEARFDALERTPQDGRLIESSIRLAERCDTVEAFWSRIVSLAEKNGDVPEIAGDLWYRAGIAYERDISDPARAVEYYERALSSGHKAKRSFQALSRVLDDDREPERAKAALTTFVAWKDAAENPDVLADALYRLAKIEFREGQPSAGANHLFQALELLPQEERARELLEPVVRSGAADERVVILFLRVCRKSADPDTLLFAFREAAKTATVEQTVLDEAVGLARRQDDGDALRELLSRSIELAGERDNEESVHRLIVERALLARSDGEFSLEAELLSRAIPYLAGDDRFELRLRLAACMTQDLGLDQEGQRAYEDLLREAPAESRVWRPLLGIYRAAGRPEAVEELIGAVAEHVHDESDLAALKMERVRLMIGQQRFEEAEQELRTVLAERPSLTEAAGILVELLRHSERQDELRDLLDSLYRDALNSNHEEAVATYAMELAKLIAETDREEAINILNGSLHVTKSRKDVLLYMLDLYSESDNQTERADVMEYLLALESGEAARGLSLELFELRSELSDEYGAGRALELGVRAAPRDAGLLERYIEHLKRQDDYGALAEALLLRAGQLSGAEAARLYAEVSDICEQTLGDPARAAQISSKAFDCDPTSAKYLEKYANQLVAIGETGEALGRLGRVIDEGRVSGMADLLELRASIIKREMPGDREAMTLAAEDLVRALGQLIPEEQEIALQQNRIELLSELRVLHQVEGDDAAEREVVRDLAGLMLETDDAFGAIDVLTSFVRDHETDAEVCAQLGDIASNAGDAAAAVYAYERLVAASEGEQRTTAVLLLADAALAAGEPGSARLALERAFAEQPDNALILERLRHIYEEGGSFAELANLLVAEAERSHDAQTRAELLLQVGDLYLRAGDAASACGVLEQARTISENPYLIAAKLAEVYLAQNDVDKAEELLLESIAAHGKRRSPELALLQQGLSQVCRARGDVDGMFNWLEAALMSDRANGEVAQELAIGAQEAGRYEIAIKALQSLTLSKVEGPMSKAEAYMRQAQIAQAQGDDKKALLMARRAQATDPNFEGVEELVAYLGG